MNSIPAGLPINEASRVLSYCKAKYQPGFMFKSDLSNVARRVGKDQRTLRKLFERLINAGLIGEDARAYYFRSWRFISTLEGFNQQAFRASLSELSSKEKFEGLLFGAKVTSIQKAIRKGQVRKRGCTDQSPSSGFLANACKISQGKVSELKRLASTQGLITVDRSFEDHGNGTPQTASILKGELPGVFLKDGKLMRRKADRIFSNVETFRIKNRKQYEHRK